MPTRSEMLPLALAVKQRLLRPEQVKACMDLQDSKAEEGIEVRLDDLAVAEGLISPQQLNTLRGAADSVDHAPQGIDIEDARAIHIYDFIEKIGQGGMATVFRAIHKPTGETRAVKVLFKEHATNPTFVRRFLREGKLLKGFDSDNIARGFEYGQLKGKELYFMGMEMLEGFSLQEMLDDEGPFSEQKAIYSVTEAARALAYMQAQGIVHRDIKPENIMWCRDGRIVLVDLGFAKPIEQDGGEMFEDETCGTVQYISPEQARGRSDVDIRADIYSLGATLYHLVLGALPFTGKDPMEVMTKQVTDGLDPSQLKSGKLSMHMHYFIEKMMAKDREIRYQSAQEVVTDIDATLEGAAELQYDPAGGTSELDPFETLSINASAISGRRPSARSSVRKQPISGMSQRKSVRMPEQRSSVRMPPAPPRPPSNPQQPPQPPANPQQPSNDDSGASVRLPQRRRRSQG